MKHHTQKNKKTIFFTALFCISHIMFFSSPSISKVYIDIHAPSLKQFPVIVADFLNTGSEPDKHNIATKMSKFLKDDLAFCGFFKIIPYEKLGKKVIEGLNADSIKWDMLTMLGAEAVITAGYSVSQKGVIETEFRLFDAVERKFLVGRRYAGSVDDWRTIVHKFSNEIFEKMTGQRGIFETRIAFVKGGVEQRDIHIMDYDGGNETRITKHNSIMLSPAWSPDGKSIAFTSYRDGNPDLHLLNLSTKQTSRISRKYGINIAPSWSPDSKKIALTLRLTDSNSEIYALTLSNGKLERLTHDWGIDVSPSWSPDGQNIAFVSNRAGSPQIFIMNLTGGNVRRLTFEGSYNTSPNWSPSGDMIVYTGLADKKFNIFVISTDGGFSKQLTANQQNNEDPSWSPDGRFITFSSNRTGEKEIYIMRADGTGQKRITSGQGMKTHPCWSPFQN